jgi:hypothetical protein
VKPAAIDEVALRWLWEKKTIPEICDILACPRRRLYYYVAKYKLPPKPQGTHGVRTGFRIPDPTPEEIEAGMRAVQATWSDEERERRAGMSKLRIVVKALRYDGRNVSFSEM